MTIRRNSELTGLYISLAGGAAGLLLIALPLLAGLDGMAGGYALAYVGALILLTGAVSAAFFGHRARRLVALFSGRNLLARWRYAPLQVEEQARRERRATSRNNLSLILTIAVFMLACTGLFVGYGFLSGEGENMPAFAGIMLAILLLLAAFAFGMPAVQYRRALRSDPEALIGTDGLYINGALHTWSPPLAGLDGVSLVSDEAGARLSFAVRSRTGLGPGSYSAYTVEVPVPPGDEETARGIVRHFQDRGPA